MQTFDIIVVGAGIIGSSTLFSLSKRYPNSKILLLEQFELYHPKGSSHGHSRIFRLHYNDFTYSTMAKESLKHWKQIEQESGCKLYTETGGVDFGDAGNARTPRLIQVAKQGNLEYEYFDKKEEFVPRFPALEFVRPGTVLFYQKDAGILDAQESVRAMLKLAEKQGNCTVHQKEKLIEFEYSPEQKLFTLNTSVSGTSPEFDVQHNQYVTKKLVLCAGAWTKHLLEKHNPSLKLNVTTYQMSYAFLKVKQEYINRFSKMPVWSFKPSPEREKEEDYGYYGFPIFEEPGMMKVAMHKAVDSLDRLEHPDERSFEMPEFKYQKMVQFAESTFGMDCFDLEKQPSKQVTCLYSNTGNTDFVMDVDPTNENLVMFTGCSGHAFKFAPVLGDCIASLVENPHCKKLLDTYDRERFSVAAHMQK